MSHRFAELRAAAGSLGASPAPAGFRTGASVVEVSWAFLQGLSSLLRSMGQTFSINGPPGGQYVMGMGGALTATWETRYELAHDAVVEIWQVGGSCIHPTNKACRIRPGGRSGSVILHNTSQLAVGSEYYLKWKMADGWVFSGKLLAASEKFAVHTMQSIMMQQEASKAEAKAAVKKAEAAKARQKTEAKATADAAILTKAHSSVMPVTTAERKVFRKYFDLIDTDEDEVLSADELLAYMADLGFELSEGALNKMMADADINSDGAIDFKEFCQVLKRAEDANTSKGWMKAQAKIGQEIFCEQRTTSNPERTTSNSTAAEGIPGSQPAAKKKKKEAAPKQKAAPKKKAAPKRKAPAAKGAAAKKGKKN